MASSVAQLLRTVRAHFNLSQRQLAPWLGVSDRLAAYAETGARRLSLAGLAQLSRLTALLPPADAVPAEETLRAPTDALDALDALDPVPLRARLAACAYEATALRRELTQRTARLTTNRRLLAAVAALLPSAANPRETLWLELRALEATRAVRACAPTTLALRRARLAALEAEMNWLTAHLPA